MKYIYKDGKTIVESTADLDATLFTPLTETEPEEAETELEKKKTSSKKKTSK